jgi:hypothetical protein
MRPDSVATPFPVIAITSGTFGVNNVKRGSAETKAFSPSRSRRGVPLVETMHATFGVKEAFGSPTPNELHLTAQIEFSFYERYFNP